MHMVGHDAENVHLAARLVALLQKAINGNLGKSGLGKWRAPGRNADGEEARSPGNLVQMAR
jgi:hypothetical protein